MAMTSATTLDDPARAAVPASAGRALAPHARLRDYEITGLVGERAHSIVYLAWDHSLQRKVALKEYMPASIASRVAGSCEVTVKSERQLDTFRAGLKSFVNEARLLARFDHPSLVKVYRFWEENGTAYMVMPFYEGPTLKAALAELDHVPGESELRTWLRPVLDAVAVLHEQSIVHQRIGPDEIVLTPTGPVLLGMAMPQQTLAALAGTPASALKRGFAAPEQYVPPAGTRAAPEGPWTDLYALAAIVHSAITGSEPVPANGRLGVDRLPTLQLVAAGLYDARFLAGIDAALAVDPARRPRDHKSMRALIGDLEPAVAAVVLVPQRDPMDEPFLARAAADRVITVPDHPLLATAAAPAAAPAPAEARPRLPTSLPASPASPAAIAHAARPSWASTAGNTARRPGKRLLYGAIAATCALVGVAALVLQMPGRPSPTRSAVPTPSTAPEHSSPRAATAMPAAISPATSTAATSTTPAPVAVMATPATTAAVPARAVATASLPSTNASAGGPERQTRCLDILQKASLEPISPAETEFFKRECNR